MILFAKPKQRSRCREQMYRHQGGKGVGWTGRLGLMVGLSAFPVAQTVKNLPAMQATWVWSRGQEDSLEKGMATHSSILAWRISLTEEPGRLQFMESQRVGYNWVVNTIYPAAAATAKSLQSCPTLCNPIDGSPPSSPIPGILQARTLEWAVISFSNAWKWKVKVKSLSRVRLLATPWTAAYQAPPSMEFSRQEYWSGVQLPSQTIYPTMYKTDN